ncbi:MAG: ATP-binding protein [Bdellovibrionota bacterium]
MDTPGPPSLAYLQQCVSLYRGLFALIREQRSEAEVIHFVVDAIYEHFRDYRCVFSVLSPGGEVKIRYSREAESARSLIDKTVNIAGAVGLEEAFRAGKANVVSDIRLEPAFAMSAESIVAIGGNISRVDVPVFAIDDQIYILSLTHSTPIQWAPEVVELLKEMAQPVELLLREARSREEYQRTETMFNQFADNVELVFWMSDTKKNEMIYVSPSYEQIWGRTAQSLYENPISFLEAIHPGDRERVRAAVMKQPEGNYLEEYRVVRPDGKVRWVKDRAFLVRDNAGKVYRIVGIAEDITALREAQDRLVYTQAQVVSNAKFAALGEMASGIAHEINNPLAVIHGLSVQLQELFREGSASVPMVLESLSSMEKMSNRIAAIVKGLKTFSRSTVGDPMSPADLNLVVQETMALCEARLKASEVVVQVKLPAEPVMVSCRSAEISQVLLNLISNAFDAVQGVAAPSVSVEVVRHGNRARIQVEDSGVGITPAVRDRIFQPFFTTKEVGKGTGLGLSISKGIIEAHGGTLFLDMSAKRTRFVIELPA